MFWVEAPSSRDSFLKRRCESISLNSSWLCHFFFWGNFCCSGVQYNVRHPAHHDSLSGSLSHSGCCWELSYSAAVCWGNAPGQSQCLRWSDNSWSKDGGEKQHRGFQKSSFQMLWFPWWRERWVFIRVLCLWRNLFLHGDYNLSPNSSQPWYFNSHFSSSPKRQAFERNSKTIFETFALLLILWMS